MESLNLSLNVHELLYLAKRTDGNMLPGIADPYRYMSSAQQESEEALAEENLIEKGIIKASFGGGKTIPEQVRDMISCCTLCSRYLAFDKNVSKKVLITERFYYDQKNWVRISGNNEEFSVNVTSGDEICKMLKAELPFSKRKFPEKDKILMPFTDWKKLSNALSFFDQKTIKEIMQKYQISKVYESFLKRSLGSETGYTAFTLAERRKNTMAVQTVSLLSGNGYLMELYHIVQQDRTMVGGISAEDGKYPLMWEVAEKWLTVSL